MRAQYDHFIRHKWFCAGCGKTAWFVWIVDGFHCVGDAEAQREGCGKVLYPWGRDANQARNSSTGRAPQ